MKNEAEVCSIITRSYDKLVKIPDPSGNFTQTSIRCFDGIGSLPISVIFNDETEEKDVFVCWEAKHLKGMQAFSFKRVEPHQDYYLAEYSKCDNVYALLLVGVSVARGDNRIYVFDYSSCGHYLYQANWSIHKQYLEKLPYNKVSKGQFKIENIIRWPELITAYGSLLFKSEVMSKI